MCERCKQGDVKVGDVVWRAVIDTRLNDDKPIVVCASAEIESAPNKNLEVKLCKTGDFRVFMGLGRMVPLRALQHSRDAALRERLDIEAENLAHAQARYDAAKSAYAKEHSR